MLIYTAHPTRHAAVLAACAQKCIAILTGPECYLSAHGLEHGVGDPLKVPEDSRDAKTGIHAICAAVRIDPETGANIGMVRVARTTEEAQAKVLEDVTTAVHASDRV